MELEIKVNKDERQVFRPVPEMQGLALKHEVTTRPSSKNFEHLPSSGSIYSVDSAGLANLLPSYSGARPSLQLAIQHARIQQHVLPESTREP